MKVTRQSNVLFYHNVPTGIRIQLVEAEGATRASVPSFLMPSVRQSSLHTHVRLCFRAGITHNDQDSASTNSSSSRVSGCGVILLGGEVYKWRPWLNPSTSTTTPSSQQGHPSGTLLNSKRQFEPSPSLSPWSLLELVHPKPDLLIIGTGKGIVPISPLTRRYINDLGIRIEVQDTRNAASQYNLLATERGVGQVGAAMVPVGWSETKR